MNAETLNSVTVQALVRVAQRILHPDHVAEQRGIACVSCEYDGPTPPPGVVTAFFYTLWTAKGGRVAMQSDGRGRAETRSATRARPTGLPPFHRPIAHPPLHSVSFACAMFPPLLPPSLLCTLLPPNHSLPLSLPSFLPPPPWGRLGPPAFPPILSLSSSPPCRSHL